MGSSGRDFVAPDTGFGCNAYLLGAPAFAISSDLLHGVRRRIERLQGVCGRATNNLRGGGPGGMPAAQGRGGRRTRGAAAFCPALEGLGKGPDLRPGKRARRRQAGGLPGRQKVWPGRKASPKPFDLGPWPDWCVRAPAQCNPCKRSGCLDVGDAGRWRTGPRAIPSSAPNNGFGEALRPVTPRACSRSACSRPRSRSGGRAGGRGRASGSEGGSSPVPHARRRSGSAPVPCGSVPPGALGRRRESPG